MNPKKPAESAVESRYLLMPNQANAQGTAFGGAIMALIDMVAAMAAQRHAGTEVVTASIDSLSFKQPIFIGDQVILKACVNYVGHTSMEVGVKVMRENPATGQQTVTTTAHLTMVAIDEDNRPTTVPSLEPETEDEKRRYKNACLRVQTRKELREKIHHRRETK